MTGNPGIADREGRRNVSEPTCGVCGRPWRCAAPDDPPTFRNVQVGTDADGRPIVRYVLSKPIRMDPETGAVCWCTDEENQATDDAKGGER